MKSRPQFVTTILAIVLSANVLAPNGLELQGQAADDNELQNQAMAALHAKKYQLAIERFMKILRADTSSTLARKNLGVAYNNLGNRAKSPLEARVLYERSLYFSPGNKPAVQNLNETLRLLRVNPSSFPARVRLADELLKRKDHLGAIIEYRQALKISNDTNIRARLAQIPNPIQELPFYDGELVETTATTMGTRPGAQLAQTGTSANQSVSSQLNQLAAIKRQPISGTPAKVEVRNSSSSSAASSMQDLDDGEDRARILTLSEAKAYLLELINRDRALFKLRPVVMDETASIAAQIHSEDTAARGYNDHYDLAGRSPDWRYTLVGGTRVVKENQLGVFCDSGARYRLCHKQRFARQEIEEVESAFFDESPPQDGHRRNILDPLHTSVGLGLASALVEKASGEQEIDVACCEEFVHSYGKVSALPHMVRPGDELTLEGKIPSGLPLQGVSIYRDVLPEPRSLRSLRTNQYHGYELPRTEVENYAAGQIRRSVNGDFRVTIATSSYWPDGLYHVVVWAKVGGFEPFEISRQVVAIMRNPKPELIQKPGSTQ